MSTVLLVGMASGAVYAVDLRQKHIEMRKLTKYYILYIIEKYLLI